MTGQPAPRVSVLMPVYNGEKYLRQAVESILAQTYADFEFIIVDDGSTDASPKILKHFDDPRIRIITHTANQGVVASLNDGIARARGEYIARMDADDISLPERFKIQVEFLDSHPKVGVLGASVNLIDESGQVTGQNVPVETHNLLFWTLFFGCPYVHPTIMMRRDLLIQAGGYPSGFVSEDYALWCILGKLTKMHNLPDILLHYRCHASQVTRDTARDFKESNSLIRQRMFSGFLGRPIPIESIKCLKGGACRIDVVNQSCELLLNLYRKIRADCSLSNVEYAFVRSTFATTLYSLAKRWNARTLMYLFYAVLLEPALLKDIWKAFLRKIGFSSTAYNY